MNECLEILVAPLALFHLGMELQTEQASFQVPHGGIAAVLGARQSNETRRQFVDLVAVGHPDDGAVRCVARSLARKDSASVG